MVPELMRLQEKKGRREKRGRGGGKKWGSKGEWVALLSNIDPLEVNPLMLVGNLEKRGVGS